MLSFRGARSACAILAFLVLGGCRAAGCVANTFGDVVGETGDVACDRRYVDNDAAEPFCQEVIDTVAVSDVKDDCGGKHRARAHDGRCDRTRVIAGCKISKVNDDGSEVWDWYYDVSDMLDSGAAFLPGSYPLTKDDIKKKCADPKRYDEGASYVE